MVVEDESIVALNLQRRLISLGYDVTCVAASHDQALKGAAETRPDIVLMDINISGDIDGIDTAAKISAPVIYLTAYSGDQTLERAKATCPYGYLVKPFSERELHATIQMALERRREEERLLDCKQDMARAYARIEASKRELEASAAELFQEKERLQLTMNAMGEGVITTDGIGNVTFLNPIAEAMTGWSLEEAIGQPMDKVWVLMDEKTCAPLQPSTDSLLRLGDISQLTDNGVLISKQGRVYSIEGSVAQIHDRDAAIIGTVLVFHDVSDARRLAAEMTYQATHDTLTGLANRREFERRMEKAIGSVERYGQHHVLIYLDLDKFKIVNDSCGHDAGDELLRQVTGLLRLNLRANDTLARLGGDEFGLLLESCSVEMALRIAQNLRNIISDFHFVWNGKTFPVGVSAGIVGFGGKVQANRMNLQEILKAADSACYTAKHLGRNCIHVYPPENQT
jgi:diguanylate cyclase (GGDEF)-like protein/PAS domain S-box-containing protein